LSPRGHDLILSVPKPTPAEVRYIDHPDYHRPDAEQMLFARGEKLPPLPPPLMLDLRLEPPKGPTGMPAVLTRDEEKLAFRRYNYAKLRLSKATTAAQCLPWAKRATHLREHLTRTNMPLIPHAYLLLNPGRRAELDPQDAFSEGCRALLRCIEAFDIGRGFKFSTYTVRAILNQICRVAQIATERTARFPLTELSNWSSDDDGRAAEADERPLWDEVEQLHTILDNNDAGLSDPERYVIQHRFFADKKVTHTRCAEGLGCSKERARQLEMSALAKLREFMTADAA
jgi:RNA polymerase sigma factor (sigma-70 family)